MKILVKILRSTVQRIVKEQGRQMPDNMKMGRGSYFGTHCTFVARPGATITIGNYCSLANGVALINANHRADLVSTYPIYAKIWRDGKRQDQGRDVADISIGHDVWLGTNAVVLKGVTIGHGAIVGAGAVVTKSVPPYGIVAGNPARLIKYRFSDEEIGALLKIGWWHWPEAEIRRNAEAFHLPVPQFIERFL